MIFGMLAIALALAGTLVSTAAYLRWMIAERRAETGGKREKEAAKVIESVCAPIARWGFILSFAMLALAILQVETAAYSHDFTLSYIARFSSRDEPKDYLFATLWAGQEGTFLLWCTYVTILGLIVCRYAKTYEAPVMFFLNLIRLSLLVVLVGKSPFAPTPTLLPAALQGAGINTLHQAIWAFFHPGGLILSQTPIDGQGLNPLLQNKWMRIHPPTLFFGFSATSVPFAYAMAALWKKDYDGWVRRALPWAALAFTVLGTGIMMGGYWAYSVLGWGGFWGWDPVENSSKVPWLMTVLLLHGMVMQQRKNTWHRATALFGILPFLMVTFSSFLTRSGILENFSVHSFAKEDDLFPYLIGPLCFFWMIGIGLWISRLKTFPEARAEAKPWSAPALLYWGVGTVAVFAACVWAGMSSPLLTGIGAGIREKIPALTFLPSATSNVSTSYYNFIATPVSIFAALMMSLLPLLSWRDTDFKRTWPKVMAPLALALVVVGIAVHYGVGQDRPPFEIWRWHAGSDAYRLVLPAMIPLLSIVFAGSMALFSSLQVVFQSPRKVQRLGGFLAHAGIGVLLIGVVTSELSGQSQRISLVKGGPAQSVLGYQVQYNGMYQPSPTGKSALDLTFSRGEESFKTPTPMYFSKYNGQFMFAPFIHKYPGYDLYVAPEGPPMSTADAAKRQVDMAAGQEAELIDGVKVRFVKFDIGGRIGGKIRVGSELDVYRNGKTERVTPYWEAAPGQAKPDSVPATTRDGDVTVEIGGLNANTQSATFIIGGHALGQPPGPPQEIALLNVSTKPMINLVWLATFLVMCGGLLTLKRSFGDLARAEARDRGRYADRDESTDRDDSTDDSTRGDGGGSGPGGGSGRTEKRKPREERETVAGAHFVKRTP